MGMQASGNEARQSKQVLQLKLNKVLGDINTKEL